MNTEQLRLVAQVGMRYPRRIAASPDGKLLVTHGVDSAVLWDVATGCELRRVRTEGKSEFASFRDDSTVVLVSTPFDPGLRAVYTVWDVVGGAVAMSAHDRAAGFNLSTDGKYSITSDEQGCSVWSVPADSSSDAVRTFAGAANGACHVEGDVALIGGRAFRVSTGELIADLSAMGHSFALEAGGARVFVSATGPAVVWDLGLGKVEAAVSGAVTVLQRSADGSLLLLTMSKGPVVWDVAAAKAVATLQELATDHLLAGKRWVVAIDDATHVTFLAWDLLSGGAAVPKFQSLVLDVYRPSISPDLTALLTRSGEGFRIWDLRNGRAPRVLSAGLNTAEIEAARFAPPAVQLEFILDGRADGALVRAAIGPVFAAAVGNQVGVYSTISGELLKTISGVESAPIRSLAADMTGTFLVSAETDSGGVTLWDVNAKTATLLGPFLFAPWGENGPVGPPTGPVHAAVSTGANRVATVHGAQHGQLVLWDLKSKKKLNGDIDFVPFDCLPVFLNDKQLFFVAHEEDIEQETFSGVVMDRSGNRVHEFALPSKIGAVSGSGNFYAAAPGVDTAHLSFFDLTTGELARKSVAISDEVTGVAYSADGKWVVTTSYEGVTRIWDAATAAEVVAVIGFMDGSWAVVDPQGRYDASDPSDIPGLHFAAGLSPIRISQLKQRFYTPGLLQRAMQGDLMPDVSGMLQTVANVPDVSYGLPVDGKLTVTVTNRGGGLGLVVVRVNGREFKTYQRPPGFSADAPVAKWVEDLSSALTAPDGKNTFEVLAFDQASVVSSRGSISFVDTTPPPAVQPSLFAIVIGCSAFANTAMNLKFPAVDAQKMAAALEVCAKPELYASKSIALFVSGVVGGQMPTKANISAAFEAVVGKAKPGDVFLLFLAGHGISAPGLPDSYYFLTSDARTFDLGNDQSLLDVSTVSGGELKQWGLRIQALKQVMIMDTCAAGAAFNSQVHVPAARAVSPDVQRAILALKDGTGSYVIFGAAGNKLSFESPKFGHGLLTYALLEGMSTVSAQGQSDVAVGDWFEFAQAKVEQIAPSLGEVQKPLISAPNGQTFPLGVLTADERKAIQPPGEKPELLRVECLIGGTVVDRAVTKAMRDQFNGMMIPMSQGGMGPEDPKFVYLDFLFGDLAGSYVPRVSYSLADGSAMASVVVAKDGAVVFSESVTAAVGDLGGVAAGKIIGFMDGI